MLPDFCHKFLPYFRGGVQEGAVTPAGKLIFANTFSSQGFLASPRNMGQGTMMAWATLVVPCAET